MTIYSADNFDRKELIRWCYRILLDREPESEDAITAIEASKVSSLHELKEIFYSSQEYKEKHKPNEVSRYPVSEYAGYTEQDIVMLEKYLHPGPSESGFITDFMGIRHSVVDLPFLATRDGETSKSIPVPDDGFHAEAIEYVALLLSVEEASNERYTMFELGAGWGPWMSAAGAACKKKGVKSINLVGLDGASNKMPLIKRHLAVNGFRPDSDDLETFLDGVKVKIYDGVITIDGRNAEFPEVSIEHYGASLLSSSNAMQLNKTRMAQGYSLSDLTKKYSMIDLIHMDLQGYEEALLTGGIKFFTKKVKYLAIATHTRKIEGILSEFMYENGFKLVREKPCVVAWPEIAPACFVDATTKDGMQVWRNKRF